jgi:excinuclease ABC subunit B
MYPERSSFRLEAPFEPTGDQPAAIGELIGGLEAAERWQTLMGVTGSGKTLSIAHVVAHWGRPTLVMSHNKTLAAQLYGELKQFFPSNAVEYFISYYDYYQPEAYVPQTDTYIEKDASINEDIDRLRLRATSSLMERDDVIVVASVSAIYGLGDPAEYRDLLVLLQRGEERSRDDILAALVDVQYNRNDLDFKRGTFRVRGDVVEVYPAYEEQAVRIELWGDEIDRLTKINPLTGDVIAELDRSAIYPARPSGSRIVRATISRCFARWASVPESRTTRAIWPAVQQMSGLPVCSTTSRTTSSSSWTSRT